MKLAIGLAVTSVCIVSITGCTNYRPLADEDVVRIQAWGENTPIVDDGVKYGGGVFACIRHPSSGAHCGYRNDPEEEFTLDYFSADNGLEETRLNCYDWAYSNDVIRMATCKAFFEDCSPGRQFRITVNDFTESVVTLPEISVPTSPTEGSELSISSGDGLPLSWEPLNRGDRMGWGLYPPIEKEPGDCLSQDSWSGSEGFDLEDNGSAVIPQSDLPPTVPAEGCRVIVSLSRERSGALDPGIKNGIIAGSQHYAVKVTLKP